MRALFACLVPLIAAAPAVAQVTRDTIAVTETGATVERVTWLSGGHEVFGYLATPEGPGPFPVVVRLRGGNRSFGAYSPERAVRSLGQLAGWGYLAIAPQYRGATDPEEGPSADEFGGAEVDDIFAMIDLLPELEPAADTSRVGLDGWSRGGMMALLALRRSDRFRAAVLVGSMSDLERMAADRPVMLEVYQDLFGTPDSAEFRRRIRERSGARWPGELPADTPILILHGGADWRVSPLQTLDLATGLQAAGRFYRIVVVPGADHSLSDVAEERDAERRAWFDRWVRDQEPVPRQEQP
jgi:dipeptidyl aminopeptidase/acylaminoacyl peptidase